MSDVETVEIPSETPPMMPGKNGGKLKRGGKNPNAGRPKDVVRQACSLAFEKRIPVLVKIADGKVDGAGVEQRLKAIDLLGKYAGLQKIETEQHDGTLEDLMREAAASDGDGAES